MYIKDQISDEMMLLSLLSFQFLLTKNGIKLYTYSDEPLSKCVCVSVCVHVD